MPGLIPWGIWAASKATATAGDYELISTTVVSGSTTSTVTFDVSTFSTTYKHLQFRSSLRTLSATTESDPYGIRFNSDASANYSWHILGYTGTAGSIASTGTNGYTYAWNMPIPGANYTSNAYGIYITDILDPFSTAKNKTLRSLCGYEGSSPRLYFNSSAWYSTNAVTSITISTINGANFASGSRISLYGLRG